MPLPFRKPKLQQQFVPRDSTSAFDCTATSGGMLGDADSRGRFVFTHSQVRRATDERIPDPESPGLNWNQVDVALARLTSGAVDLNVYPTGSSWGRVPTSCRAGRWAGLAIWRGVLVDAGLGGTSPFRGGHAVVLGYDQNEKRPILGDPLVPYWQNASWALLERACAEFMRRTGNGGGAYYCLTRDVYDVPAPTLKYSALFSAGEFFVYHVSGSTITGRETYPGFSKDTSAPCTKPALYSWPEGGDRKLVMVTSGAIDGKYVEPGSTNVTLKVSPA